MTEFDLRNEMMTRLPSPFRLLHILQRSAQFVMEPHSHQFYHVNFVTSGSLVVTYQDKEYVVSEGQAVVLPPHIPHALAAPDGYSQIGIDILDVSDERGIHDLLCSSFPEGFAIVTMLSFPRSFEQLFKAIRNLTTLNTLKLLNAAEAFVLELIEQAHYTRNPNFRDSFLDMISKKNGLTLTLDQMGKQMNLSKTHLERMTRAAFGCGAIEYCSKVKLMKACLLLQNTDLSIKLIAENLGYYDESHFSSFFKKRMQMTPNIYRNNSRQLVYDI